LLDYQSNNKKIKHSGLVDKEGAALIDIGEMPDWWCQGSSRNDMQYREWEQENDILKPIIDKIYERMEELYIYFSEKDIEEHAKDIRIVFWFDN
jgi:hypothetical protein